jgi:hypothetical protein
LSPEQLPTSLPVTPWLSYVGLGGALIAGAAPQYPMVHYGGPPTTMLVTSVNASSL